MTEEPVNIENEVRPEDVPLPPSSKMSIRLSDLHFEPKAHESLSEVESTDTITPITTVPETLAPQEPEKPAETNRTSLSRPESVLSAKEPEEGFSPISPRFSHTERFSASHQPEEEEETDNNLSVSDRSSVSDGRSSSEESEEGSEEGSGEGSEEEEDSEEDSIRAKSHTLDHELVTLPVKPQESSSLKHEQSLDLQKAVDAPTETGEYTPPTSPHLSNSESIPPHIDTDEEFSPHTSHSIQPTTPRSSRKPLLSSPLISPGSTSHNKLSIAEKLTNVSHITSPRTSISLNDASTEHETEPEDVSLPRSSLMTVRLSDANIPPQSTERKGDDLISPESPRSSRSKTASFSSDTRSPSSAASVDWEVLDRTEDQEPKDEATDESTALLLARLEKENAAIAVDPKSGIASEVRPRRGTRPPSIQHIKKLVTGPQRESLRYSIVSAPPMTELEFWAALVQDFAQTAHRLPTLTSNKIRGGVPPPLRGVVWPSIAGAQDNALHAEFQKLSRESSPYDGLIGKDVSRSFPNVEMFREKDGEGQRMLGRVLKAFSLHDIKIGYCQGLGFVVGPLLMHMGEAEAFSILVRLMEHYDLRSCYLPDLSGLHLRIYQFQILLSQHLPQLASHLETLKVEPLYVSQWFLSFFAVTCPLPLLLRIYDVLLAEGAIETLMRVALSLMQRNQSKLLAFTEFEDIMQFLLSRSLWDTYSLQADDLVADFVALTGLVSREALQNLEASFKTNQHLTQIYALKNAASSFLGRVWAGSYNSVKSGNLALMIPGSRGLRKSASGNSLNSTLNSVETSASDASTLATALSEASSIKIGAVNGSSPDTVVVTNHTQADRDLHHQIEELLTALSKVQHQQMELTRELQQEREERAEEREIGRSVLIRYQDQVQLIRELAGDDSGENDTETDDLIAKAQSQFSSERKRVSILQSKHQLRDAAVEWKTKHDDQVVQCKELTKQLDEEKAENASLKENLREARVRIQDAIREKQRLERTASELRKRNSSTPDSPSDSYTPVNEYAEAKSPPSKSGLRELRLGRPESLRPGSLGTVSSMSTATFSKRSSSLNTQTILATENHEPVNADALLLELVNSKTAEAVARQELEETKGKLDALRKILGGPTSSPVSRITSSESPTNGILGFHLPGLGGGSSSSGNSANINNHNYTNGGTSPSPKETIKPSTSHTASASTGGFFSAWVKRAT